MEVIKNQTVQMSRMMMLKTQDGMKHFELLLTIALHSHKFHLSSEHFKHTAGLYCFLRFVYRTSKRTTDIHFHF